MALYFKKFIFFVMLCYFLVYNRVIQLYIIVRLVSGLFLIL